MTIDPTSHPSAQMFNILENSESPQVKLVNEWGQGFEKRDIDLIAKLLHKDYRHITYPRSLGRPEQTREEWLQHIAGAINIWSQDETTVHSVIDIPGKVIVHFTNKVKTSIGVETIRESIYIMQIVTDEDGTLKLKQSEDFTDSKAYLDFIQDITAAKANKEQRSYAA